MKERPIIFSGEMVRAILAGRKTQTRRVMRPQPQSYEGGVHPNHTAKHPAPYIDAYCGERKTDVNPRGMGLTWCWWTEDDRVGPSVGRCPYGQPGDRLWVREAWAAHFIWNGCPPRAITWDDGTCTFYAADGAIRGGCSESQRGQHRPGMFMPRSASRITLEVTGVRVERVQSISEAEAIAEGIAPRGIDDAFCEGPAWYRMGFTDLWGSINGKREGCSWEANPWVWVVEFRRLEPAS